MNPTAAGAEPDDDQGSTGPGPLEPEVASTYSVFDDLTDVVTVIDHEFAIVYANRFALTLLGYRRADLEGRLVTDFLKPEEAIRAFEIVDLMTHHRLGVPITPALFDVRRADGGWLPVELNAVTPPAGTPEGHILVIGRYSGDHDLQNRILELITADGSDAELIDLIPRFGSWRHPDEQYAVLYTDVDDTDQVTGTDIIVEVIGRHAGGDAPWARARRERSEVLIEDPSMLPAALRRDAEAAALGPCWAMPVADPLHDAPAVIVGWSRKLGPPASVHRYALETMGRMLALVLQWRRQREDLERAARRDPLTQVANRAGFFDVLGDALAHTDRETVVGLLYIDLDGFKDVNDRYGHSVGDDVLRIVADRLAAAVRRGDLLGRLGGDEFAVLCPIVTDIDVLTIIARRIIDDVARPIAVRGIELQVGASIGIATSVGAVLPDQLVDAADRSLYEAKEAGRGRWHLAAGSEGALDEPMATGSDRNPRIGHPD